MSWALWALLVYAAIALVVGGVTAVVTQDMPTKDMLAASAMMGLGWPWWLVKMFLPT